MTEPVATLLRRAPARRLLVSSLLAAIAPGFAATRTRDDGGQTNWSYSPFTCRVKHVNIAP